MKCNKEIFLHVGPQKTGTTFLQRHCFPYLQDVYYVNMKDREMIERLVSITCHENPLCVHFNEVQQFLFERLNRVNESKILISYERLFGSEFNTYYDNKLITEIVKKIFIDPKIFLSIRRQDTFAESIYKHSLHKYFSIPKRRFFGISKYDEQGFKRRINLLEPGVDIPSLNWKVYIENYREEFGEDNVLILPYEMLRDHRDTYLSRLYDFLDTKGPHPRKTKYENRGYTVLSARLAFLLNPLVRTERNPFGIIINKPFFSFLSQRENKNKLIWFLTRISERISLRFFLQHIVNVFFFRKSHIIHSDLRNEILRYHFHNNKETQSLIHLDLKTYGYF